MDELTKFAEIFAPGAFRSLDFEDLTSTPNKDVDGRMFSRQSGQQLSATADQSGSGQPAAENLPAQQPNKARFAQQSSAGVRSQDTVPIRVNEDKLDEESDDFRFEGYFGLKEDTEHFEDDFELKEDTEQNQGQKPAKSTRLRHESQTYDSGDYDMPKQKTTTDQIAS
eukprot:GHVP01041311.1.p1 GENE.GHVP01041311.1~~GHVP01041311.1.p1  ORF type:complete len:168 (+),score=38.79 GHVP01041311.1:76-579(+)